MLKNEMKKKTEIKKSNKALQFTKKNFNCDLNVLHTCMCIYLFFYSIIFDLNFFSKVFHIK